jgi:hypothetical protein
VVDQVRSDSYFRDPTTGTARDNSSGLITPQVFRDAMLSMRDFGKVKTSQYGTSSSTLAIDCTYDVHEILLNHSITSLSFTNRRATNLIWPNTDLQHSRWILAANSTLTASQTDPIGTSTAYRFLCTQLTSSALRTSFEALSGVSYTTLWWLKNNGVAGCNIGFSDDVSQAVEFGGLNVTTTGTWTRYSTSFTAATTATHYAMLDNQANTILSDVLVWRPQVYASDLLPNSALFEDTLYDTTSAPVGEANILTLILKQDGVGTRTIAWPANVLWAGGPTDPVLTPTPGAYDMVSLASWDGGARWFGVLGGKVFA